MSSVGKPGKRSRQLLVFVHVVVSVGWMGAGAANVVVAATATSTASAWTRAVSYQLIERIDTYLIIPLAFATLISGLIVSWATPWGLTRYWWVLAKLLLTVAIIAFSTFGLGVWLQESIQATSGSVGRSAVGAYLVYGAGLNIVAFLFVTWLSVAKPWGRTPWAKRSRQGANHQRARRAPQRS